MEKVIQNRENKILNFIKKHWILILILLVATIVRLYFFQGTVMSGQASWWDSAEYLSQGTHYYNDIPYEVNPQRPPVFQYMIAGLLSFGANEAFIILWLSLMPSLLVIYFTYRLASSIIDKKAGLIAATLCAASWNFLFWSNRAQPDSLSLCFQLLAVYYFWELLKIGDGELESDKLLNRQKKAKTAILAGLYTALGFYFKISALLIPIIFFIFLLIKDRVNIIQKGEYWIYAGSYLAFLVPYFMWAYFTFGNIFAFTTGYSNSIIMSLPFGWQTLAFFNVFGLQIMFFIFLAGLLLCLRVLLYIDIILKDKKHAFDYRLFILILLSVVLSFYIFYIRAIEDRWVFILLPVMCIVCADILNKLYEWLNGKNLKWVGIIIIIALLAGSAYEQTKYGASIIENKKFSYSEIKNAAEWMKANSGPNELMMSVSYPQTLFYSQREVTTYSNMNQSMFEEYVKLNHPTYLMVSIIEPNHPQFIFSWVLDSSNVVPMNAYYDEQERPLVGIYKFIY